MDEGVFGLRWFRFAVLGILAVTVAILIVLLAVQTAARDRILQAEEAHFVAPALSAAPQSTVAPLTFPSSGPLRIVFAGDSLTYGLYASSESKGWRADVVTALQKKGKVTWTRGGQTGNTAKTVSSSITYPANTNLVFLELGTNDVYHTPTAQFRTDYKAVVTKVKREAPRARIVCLGIWQNHDAFNLYDPAIIDACSSSGGTYLSLYDIYEDTSNRGPAGVARFGGKSDDFHPNDKGYATIASRVLKSLGVS